MHIGECEGRWPRSVLALVLAVVLLLSSSALGDTEDDVEWSGNDPDQGPIPVLSLSLNPTQLEAQVTQSQKGSVIFQGTATVDQLRITSSITTLQAVANTGWPVTVSPQTIEMTGPGSEEFTVTVVVPPATSALLTGNVYVIGACKAPGLSPVSASCNGIVTVAPYYILHVYSGDPVVTLRAGESVTVVVEVDNWGNEPVSVQVTAVRMDEDIEVGAEDIPFIDSDESFPLNVTVKAGSGIGTGRHLVVLRFAPSGDGDASAFVDFNITVHVPSLAARLGVSGIAAICATIGAVVAIVVLFKTGKLDRFRPVVGRRGPSSR